MSIVQSTDFATGDYKISTSRLTTPDIAVFITQTERTFLLKLLGAELYTLFIADLTAIPVQIPQAARFLAIFNEFATDEPLTISDGIRKMLAGIVFYHYVRDHNLYHSLTGLVQNSNENSLSGGAVDARAAQYVTTKYAKALKTFKAIQDYIKDNLSTYPEFHGVKVEQSPFFG